MSSPAVRWRALGPTVICVLCLTFAQVSYGADEETFVRLSRTENGELIALETAIERFVKPGPKQITVDLVSAVHVGSKRYYDSLNQRFSGYDGVLYELVKPEDLDFPVEKRETNSPIPAIQKMLTQALGLSFQLEEINYRAANFVHADFTTQEFSRSMAEKGESFFSIVMRIIAASMQASESKRPQTGELALVLTLLQQPSVERELRLRRLLAKEIMQSKDLIQSINGPEGSTLITARNDKALFVLRNEIKQGGTRFAIFFGGGHMGDMAKKLTRDFGMKQTATEWVEAWDLRSEPGA